MLFAAIEEIVDILETLRRVWGHCSFWRSGLARACGCNLPTGCPVGSTELLEGDKDPEMDGRIEDMETSTKPGERQVKAAEYDV
jgi:hypothetical protein